MQFVSRKGFIIGLILCLSLSEIHGTHVRRRREANGVAKSKLSWEQILNDVGKIPILGSVFYRALVNLAQTVQRLNELTNGAFSRIAGGYPPCTIDFDGISCNGEPKNGGIVGIAKELVNSTMLPNLAKTIIIDFLDAGFFPLFDVIFGIPVKSKKNM